MPSLQMLLCTWQSLVLSITTPFFSLFLSIAYFLYRSKEAKTNIIQHYKNLAEFLRQLFNVAIANQLLNTYFESKSSCG